MNLFYSNLNTTRAIASHHGDPVDRPVYMAKYAQRFISQTHGNAWIQSCSANQMVHSSDKIRFSFA